MKRTYITRIHTQLFYKVKMTYTSFIEKWVTMLLLQKKRKKKEPNTNTKNKNCPIMLLQNVVEHSCLFSFFFFYATLIEIRVYKIPDDGSFVT